VKTPKTAKANESPAKKQTGKVLENWFNAFSNGTTIAGKSGVFYSAVSIKAGGR
jgi:hypothetical protein